MDSRPTHFLAASARDDALRRLRNVRRLVVVAGVGMAAGFAVLAQASTPPYQKHRAAEVALAVPGLKATPPARAHKRHHHKHHVPAAVASAPVTPAPAPVQSAPPPAPVAPAPAVPAPIQPPPAAPAPTPQPPVVASGGS